MPLPSPEMPAFPNVSATLSATLQSASMSFAKSKYKMPLGERAAVQIPSDVNTRAGCTDRVSASVVDYPTSVAVQ